MKSNLKLFGISLASQAACLGLLIITLFIYIFLFLIGIILWVDVLHANPNRPLSHALMLPLIMGPLMALMFSIFTLLILTIPQFIQAAIFAVTLKVGKQKYLQWSLLAIPLLAYITMFFIDISEPVWNFNLGINQTGDEKPFIFGFTLSKYLGVLFFQTVWTAFCLLYLETMLNNSPRKRFYLIIALFGFFPFMHYLMSFIKNGF